jgi:copper chaperone NosL
MAATGLGAGARFLAGNGEAAPTEPVIQYGAEMCMRCRMVIDDARFAAAWIEGDGSEVHFDDIGCAALEASERGLALDARVFVHDLSSEVWLDGRTARYVRSATLRTPMAYGVVALVDQAAADSLAHKLQGHTVRWEELAALLTQPESRQPHSGHGS